MSRSGPRLPEEEWERRRLLIVDFYITQNLPLPEVVKRMTKDHNFPATERMYKQRLKQWGFAVKNTTATEYEAMWEVHEARRRHGGKATEFTSITGNSERLYTPESIQKQRKRVTQQKRNEARAKVNEIGAIEILRRKDIRPRTPGLRTASAPSQHVQYESPLSNASLDSDSMTDGEMVDEFGTGLQRMRRSYPGHHQSPAQLQHHSNSGISQPWTGTIAATTPVTYDNRNFPDDVRQADIDVGLVFSQRSLSNAPPIRSIPETAEQEMVLAQDWVWYSCMSCMDNDARRFDVEEGHRANAKACFAQMLSSANRYILPYLAHMTCIMTGLGRYDEVYRHFLEDCCEVIDARIGQGCNYATPYRYALATELKLAVEDRINIAVSRGDAVETQKQRTELTELALKVDQLGAELLQSVEECRNLSGPGSPNELVSLHFRAHYLLSKEMVDAAVEILEACLVQAEHVLVWSHTLTIITMAMLARAYVQQGDRRHAIRKYQEAADRCKDALGPQNPFRLFILEKLANLQATVGNLALAEEHCMEVLRGRQKVLGPSHRFTWGTMDDIQKLLGPQGRADEANRLKETLLKDHWLLIDVGRHFVVPPEAYMRPQHF